MKRFSSSYTDRYSFLLLTSLILFILFSFFSPPEVFAETLTVTNSNDADEGSLRDAIENAVDGDTITFVFDHPFTIELNSQIEISKDITIIGPGAENLFISGSNKCRVFNIIEGVTSVDISGISIVKGSAYQGAGIYNSADNLTLTDCTFSDNIANGYGGGIYSRNSFLTVTNCIFSENHANFHGGGMNNGKVFPYTVKDSLIKNSVFLNNTSGQLGGGMYNLYSSPAFTNCTFSGNRAEYGSTKRYGGGVYNLNSSPVFTKCTFSGNRADHGGGMHNSNRSYPEVIDCSFSDNNAIKGGGIYNYESSPTITSCNFSENKASSLGGGMYNEISSAKVTDCLFSGNEAETNGGGLSNHSNSALTLKNCTFSSNSADYGGAINNDHSSPEVTGSSFSGNKAVSSGGGISNNNSSSPVLINCTFSNNRAGSDGSDGHGGGISNANQSSPEITNCTFSGNNVNSSMGSGIYNESNCSPMITNCIFWNDKNHEINSGTVNNSVIRDDDPHRFGNNNTNADPQLEPVKDEEGMVVYYVPGFKSSALDSGSDTGISVDQRGVSRPYGQGYDIGSCERTSYYINTSFNGKGSISPSSVDVPYGSDLSLDVVPDENNHIESIYVDSNSISFEPEDGIYTHTFSNIIADHEIRADFAPDEYGLSLFIEGKGEVVISPDLSSYVHGAEVELTAIPAGSTYFGGWSGDLTGNINPATITIDGMKAVTAGFNTKTYSISLDPGVHGTITGRTSVYWGSASHYEISPDQGYAVENVYLDGEPQGALENISLSSVTAPHKISATFVLDGDMVDRTGLEDFKITDIAKEDLSSLLASTDLPAEMFPEDLEIISDEKVISFKMERASSRDVSPSIENRDANEKYLDGVSFDIAYSDEVAGTAILPLEINMRISRDNMDRSYSYSNEAQSGDERVDPSLLDHIGILKVLSPDVYDLLEVAWSDFSEEEAKSFFVLSGDQQNYYIMIKLLLADAEADTRDLAVQAVSDNEGLYFLIFDGECDGHFKDPLVAVKKSPLTENEQRIDGCNLSGISFRTLILLLPLMFIFRKRD